MKTGFIAQYNGHYDSKHKHATNPLKDLLKLSHV